MAVKKYKVIALSVGGLGNKIFNSRDIVTEDNFPRGNAEELVKQGFLMEIETSAETVDATEDNTTPDNGDGVISIDEISRKDLIKALTGAKVEFNQNDKKEVLFELWKSLKK